MIDHLIGHFKLYERGYYFGQTEPLITELYLITNDYSYGALMEHVSHGGSDTPGQKQTQRLEP